MGQDLGGQLQDGVQVAGDLQEGRPGKSIDKFLFGQDAVEFAGMQVTQTGVRPEREFLPSIESFPAPTNISEVSHSDTRNTHFTRSLF